VTNLDLITDALRKIGMIDESATPSAEQGVIGLRLLNQLLAAWAEDGLSFPSWFPQTDNDATTPLPDWAERAVTAALSIEIAAEYDRPIPEALAVTATNSVDALRRKRFNQALQPSDLNLPVAEAGYYGHEIQG
jgi:hypothetical protein